MLRYLTERLPVMVAPRWVTRASSRSPSATCCATWSAAAELPAGVNRSFDIGGPDVLTYARDDAGATADARGLPRRRMLVAVPRADAAPVSHWVGLVTPVPTGLARPLVE